MSKERSLPLSKKHGIAPAIAVCPCCHQENGELLLLGKAADKIPNFADGTRIEGNLCARCEQELENGAFWVREVLPNEVPPKPTGGTLFFRENFARAVLSEEMFKEVVDRPGYNLAFVDPEGFKKLMEIVEEAKQYLAEREEAERKEGELA